MFTSSSITVSTISSTSDSLTPAAALKLCLSYVCKHYCVCTEHTFVYCIYKIHNSSTGILVIYVCINTYIHAYIHTYIHTYTCTHITEMQITYGLGMSAIDILVYDYHEGKYCNYHDY